MLGVASPIPISDPFNADSDVATADDEEMELETISNKPIDVDKRFDIGWFVQYAMRPRVVAVVGATDRAGTVGRTTLENLLEHYGDMTNKSFSIIPVTPTRQELWGMKCYARVSDIPDPVDMALVVVPSKACPGVVEDCGKNGVKVVVIIASGFKEIGPEGLALEVECVHICKKYGMRLVGPNCLGIMNPHHKMNATFAASPANKGSIGFISQSGAMCTAVLDWSFQYNIGFSSFVSIGSMAGVDWADLIHYMGQDEKTRAVMIYMESIGDANAFLAAARSVTLRKPVFVIKGGRTESAAIAAVSHTGSLAGSHDAFLAALRRCGVLVVDTIAEFFECALLVDKMPRPQRQGLIVITNAGGPGVVTTDAAELNGYPVLDLPKELIEELNTFLPPAWSHSNPIDVLGDASAELYAKTLDAVLRHCADTAGSICVVLSPQSVTDPSLTAKRISELYNGWRKGHRNAKCLPLVCAWMGGKAVDAGVKILNANQIPAFNLPDGAVKAISAMYRQVSLVRSVVSAPLWVANQYEYNIGAARAILEKAISQNRKLLTETESKELLETYKIPVAKSTICNSADETAAAAVATGFPVVVKLNSEIITHKSDVGGVKINIQTAEAAAQAFTEIYDKVQKINPVAFQGVSVQPMLDLSKGVELLVGCSTDPQFGPMVVFGTGGCMVEVYGDAVLGCPPLNFAECKSMISRTKVSKALDGHCGDRFPNVPVELICEVLVKFSYLVYDLWDMLSECEINPLLAHTGGVIALDARVVLHESDSVVAKPALMPRNSAL